MITLRKITLDNRRDIFKLEVPDSGLYTHFLRQDRLNAVGSPISMITRQPRVCMKALVSATTAKSWKVSR